MTNSITSNYTPNYVIPRPVVAAQTSRISGLVSPIIKGLLIGAVIGTGYVIRDWRLIWSGLAIGAGALHIAFQAPSSQVTAVREFRYRAAFEDKKNDFIRRIKGAEREALLEKLETLRKLDPNELAAFKDSEWTHPVFSDRNWPYLALRAYLDQDMDAMQVSKLFLFERVQQEGVVSRTVDQHGLDVHHIVSKSGKPLGEIYQLCDSKGKINQTMRDILRFSLDLNLLEVQHVEKALQELPLKETQFFLIDAAPLLAREKYLEQFKANKIDIYNFLLHDFKFPLFTLPDKKRGVIQHMVVPPRLYEAMLKAKFGQKAMVPNPILGYSTTETLSDPAKRIQSIPCPFVPLPTRIHYVIDSSDPLAFYAHDQVHLYLESGNPHRPLWIDLALSFKSSDRELFLALIDRNFPLYSLPKLGNFVAGRDLNEPQELFWHSLSYLAHFEPKIWEGEKGAQRIDAILRHLRSRKIPFTSLHECYMREGAKCAYSLKPWAEAAEKISSDSGQKRVEEYVGPQSAP